MKSKTYEFKKDFIINEYSKAYLLPSYFEEHATELTAISEYLYKHCKNVKNIDFNDVHAGSISLSLTHSGNPDYYVVIERLDFNFKNAKNILKLIIDKWKDLDIDSFKKFTDEGEKYGWD